VENDPTILEETERLVDEDSRGDPESLLRWTANDAEPLDDDSGVVIELHLARQPRKSLLARSLVCFAPLSDGSKSLALIAGKPLVRIRKP